MFRKGRDKPGLDDILVVPSGDSDGIEEAVDVRSLAITGVRPHCFGSRIEPRISAHGSAVTISS
jgi:hypothetical protein